MTQFSGARARLAREELPLVVVSLLEKQDFLRGWGLVEPPDF